MDGLTKAGRPGESWRTAILALGVLVTAAMMAILPRPALAAPPVGTVIGNQATATYNDAVGTPRTATSNLVQTIVSQVKSFTLTANGAKTAAPGQTVYYPHTITNTGNGTDTYALNLPTSTSFGAGPHGSLVYYLDNGSGFPVGPPITSSGPLASGTSFKFLVAGTVPAAAVSGNTATITVSVTDTNSPTGTTLTNTDTTTVANSVINVTKALSVTSGPSPSAANIKVTLSYINSGTAVANNVTITDVLPAGMTYVAGTGRWSVSGAVALTDGCDATEQAGSFPPGINFSYDSPGATCPLQAARKVIAIIPSVNAGVAGNVSFEVTIDANLSPQTINNTAQYQTATQLSFVNTNTVSYTVLQTADVVANGSATSSVDGTLEPVTVGTAAPGSTFTFNNYVWNRGNGTDTFDVTITSNNFPGGTTVTLLQQDGATTLLHTAGSGAPDTGPIPGRGAACLAPFVSDGTYCGYRVVLRVTLPATATGGPYSITKRATSVFDNTKFNEVIDTLTAVSVNAVDITNDVAAPPAGGAGVNDGLGSGLVNTGVKRTNIVTPAVGGPTTTTFQLQITNKGAVTDTFNLTAVPVAALPAGWAVVFRSSSGGSCASPGPVINATGPLAPDTAQLVCAVVTVPAAPSGNAAPGNYDIDFNTISQTNPGVNDVIRDRVTVATVQSITLTPNNTQQTFPGGAVTYTHTITNLGNTPNTASFNAGCLVDTRALWTSAAYIDANGNGTLEIGTDTLIACGSTTQPLAVGESRVVFVRVFAPGSASAADPPNLTTLTATYPLGAGTATTAVTDTTSVTDGLLLLKEQTPVNCSAPGPHAGYTQAAIPMGPNTAPGRCIAYRITSTNTTAANITSVVINDIVPPNTRIRYACSGNGAAIPTVSVGSIAASTPADAGTGTVSATVGTLTPTQQAILYFCVMIDP